MKPTSTQPANKPYEGILMATCMYACLVIHLSLYPYANWRDIGIGPFEFLQAPWIPVHQRILWSDVILNVIGYMPLGFLLATGLNRHGTFFEKALPPILCTLLSLAMEATQTWLPSRVPSKMDLLTNGLGGLLGALLAHMALHRHNTIGRVNQKLEHWLIDQAWLGMGLVCLWFLSILAPQTPAFGTGLWLGNWFDPHRNPSGTLFGLPVGFLLWIEQISPDLINYCFLVTAWLTGLAQTRPGSPRLRFLVGLIGLTLLIRLLDPLIPSPLNSWLYQTQLWLELNSTGILAAILMCITLSLTPLKPATLARIALAHLLTGWIITIFLPGVYAPETHQYAGVSLKIFFVLQEAGRWIGEVWPILALTVLMFMCRSRPSFQR